MRFLLSARWIGFFLAVVALAVVCVLMGDWQWHKREVRHESNERVEQHLAADPVPLDQVAPVGLKVTKDLEWTRVVAQGRYDPTSQVTVKFSTRDGRPGAEVVTPLLLDDGSAVLVDRGWVPTSNTAAAPSDVPAPPSGTVTVQGWLRPDSNAGADATTPVDGQVRSVSSTGLAGSLPYDVRSGYLNLREQTGGTGGLELEPKPDLGGGPHFFYGLQWWFFAGLALAGFVWFARIEWLERRAGHGGPPSTRDGDREDVSATP
ncbi:MULTISPECIES: SURF1 family protein [Aeromicrobium]|uniref:SURF1 family cytochrome oxidase biogenesis protein n=1 Tax=Aeromicrobium TaxID=2040 RepID=UPI0008329DEA|nr:MULTISPECIES: SURF1 family protein [Aeromicrobium]